LLHPVPLAAVGVLLLNDHWLKQAYPGVLSGKLSDVAGLLFFPLLLQALWEVALELRRRPWRPSQRVLHVSIALTALVFSLVKLWPPAGEAYRVVWALLQWPLFALLRLARGAELPGLHGVALVQDATDLLALPALGIAAWLGARRNRGVADRPE
jgi:hypothetical protein